METGGSIASEGKGEYMFVEGKVTDTKGQPIPGAIIDTWETDENGLYDTQVGVSRALCFLPHGVPDPKFILTTYTVLDSDRT